MAAANLDGRHRHVHRELLLGKNPAHLNARDTTLAFASRAPQTDIARLKARMGWELIPWYTITDDFDGDFGVDEWHG
ncbi:MAG: DUF899 family protein, partial [Thermoanaerobaculia bacterium]